MTAIRYNPICKAMAERLAGKGKEKIEIIGAIMHKLLHKVYEVLKTQKPFDPEYLKITLERNTASDPIQLMQ